MIHDGAKVVPASQLLQHDGFIDETAASFSVRPGHVSEALSRVLDRDPPRSVGNKCGSNELARSPMELVELLVYPLCIVSE